MSSYPSEEGIVEYFEGLVEYMRKLGYEDPRDKRIEELKADRDDARRVMKEACEANRVFVARLDAVKNCKTYICVFPDIGKIGPAYRQRDIWEATEQDDWKDVEQAIKEARDESD